MLDITYIRENKEAVQAAMKKRGVEVDVDTLLTLDESRRALMQEGDELKQRRNEMSKSQTGKPTDSAIAAAKQLREQIVSNEDALSKVHGDFDKTLRQLPNILMDDVPAGGEDDFEIIAESTIRPSEGAQQDYLTLLGHEIDLERGAKVSGARFVYIKGQLARLELALVSYVFDMLAEEGFTQVLPPVLVKEAAMAGMGYLDHDGDEIYKTQDDLYLVGTSEQALGPMHMDELLDLNTLPLRYVGFSPSFRREAGSHGKDTKGILRLHQFDKVEMFSFTTPDQSADEHEFLLKQQRSIMDSLKLPYRVIKLAAGDLGGPSAKTYDIETWIPSEGKYRETHSTSNTTDYQARRLNVRVKMESGTTKVHMLNGTAIALSRLLIALIENHQLDDGSIAIPEALHSYLPFTTITAKK